jgi:hypothetical protein
MMIPAPFPWRLARFVAALFFASAPVLAATPLRLHEISVSRFVERPGGQMWLERGLMTALGAFRKTDESPVLSTVTVPGEARDQNLITLEAWFAYRRLGPRAVENFIVNEDAWPYTIGLREYTAVLPNPEANIDDGLLVNLSTRGYASTTQKLMGGFIIDDQHRWVLIRAVGPGLRAYNVTGAMSDPVLTIFKGSLPYYTNDNWGTRPDAAEIATAAAQVGAFPLANDSADAALLVELPPGAYTAHVEPASGGAGEVLLEIYRVP